MIQKFTIQDLLQYYPKYEEGMDLNKDIVRNIQKCSDDFRYSKDKLRDKTIYV